MAKRKATVSVEIVESVEKELYENVRAYISAARAKVYTVANAEMVKAYWNVGREIVEKQGGADHAKYGDGLIKNLSVKLTAEFGPGYTGANLRYMRLVYLAFPNCHTLCDKLSWSHYRLLASVDKIEARDFYLSEAVKCKWSVRDLQRQIETQFYQRLVANHVDLSSAGKLVKRGRMEARDIILICRRSRNSRWNLCANVPPSKRLWHSAPCRRQNRKRSLRLAGL